MGVAVGGSVGVGVGVADVLRLLVRDADGVAALLVELGVEGGVLVAETVGVEVAGGVRESVGLGVGVDVPSLFVDEAVASLGEGDVDGVALVSVRESDGVVVFDPEANSPAAALKGQLPNRATNNSTAAAAAAHAPDIAQSVAPLSSQS